jgi:hypothetical protein
MKVLVACEFSGIVRDAFNKQGHDATSCDLLETDIPGFHIKDDVLKHLNKKWDLMVVFPPYTHIAVSGARHFAEKQKDGRQQQGIDFFMKLANASIPRIAIENPVGIMSSKLIRQKLNLKVVQYAGFIFENIEQKDQQLNKWCE